MPADDSLGATRAETRRNIVGHHLFMICSWVMGCVFFGVLFMALTNQAVIWTSSDNYCGSACHSMTWAAAAYYKSPHYINPVGVRASCGNCHIPYDSGHATAIEYGKLLFFKADRGGRDTWYEASRSMATKEAWENRRPALSNFFESYLTKHNYITCRGCHSLQSFGGPRSQMKLVIHQGLTKMDGYGCLQCHSNIGHIYEQLSSKVDGWYSDEQAAAGKKLFDISCSRCHGANLEGVSGPALSGVTWKQRFGGAKLLTVWGEIKGPMAEYAGVTLTTQQSLDILAYLLQQNGFAAGKQPLTDTRGLAITLPER